MTPLAAIILQLRGVRAETARILGGEFPYPDGKGALKVIDERCDKLSVKLANLHPDSSPRTIDDAVRESANFITAIIPTLGFILRSTNIRNAFEFHGPMLRLTRSVLGNHTCLLLSSEWRASPGNLMSCGLLPPSQYIMLGLPATDSANPFLLPLAGHELGHTIWEVRDFQEKYKAIVGSRILEYLQESKNFENLRRVLEITLNPSDMGETFESSRLVAEAVDWCCRQLEELFCDFFGMRLFGKSYLRAFSYQLTTLQFGQRSLGYPTLQDRCAAHKAAASVYKMELPSEYGSQFQSSSPLIYPQPIQTQIRAADEVRKSLISDLITDVGIFELPDSDEIDVKRCLENFTFFAPADEALSLSNIINAAWDALSTEKFFTEERHEVKKFEHIAELALKSIEVFEIEQCKKAAAKAESNPKV